MWEGVGVKTLGKLPCHEALDVISDLHMGGASGFQVLREAQRLAARIRVLASQQSDKRLVLILNGDVFDTLAEDISGYVALDDAEQPVARIIADPSFHAVWQALPVFPLQRSQYLPTDAHPR